MVDIRQEFIHLAGALMEHFLEGIVLFLAIGTLEHTTYYHCLNRVLP